LAASSAILYPSARTTAANESPTSLKLVSKRRTVKGCDAVSTKSPAATFNGKPTMKTLSCGISGEHAHGGVHQEQQHHHRRRDLERHHEEPAGEPEHQPEAGRARQTAAERQDAKAVGDGANQQVMAVDREEDQESQEVLPLRSVTMCSGSADRLLASLMPI
jgi:hypothetical protein